MFGKNHSPAEARAEEIDTYDHAVFSKGGTVDDRHDMHRVGKKQELRVSRRSYIYIPQ